MKKIFFAFVATLLAFTSCMKDQVYSYPTIGDISNTVAYYATDEVTVTATAECFVDVKEVNLFYKIGDAKEVSAPMTASGKVFSGKIPAAPLGTEVKYHIEATSTTGLVTKSAEVSYKVGEAPVDYTKLKLNELNGNDKFIEIINTGTDPVTMENVTIVKDSKADAVWTGPAILLKPGEFLLLYSEDVVVAGGAHEGYDEALVFHSGLSAKKAVRIELKDPAGNDVDDFNLVEVAKTAPASYSRVPDGSGVWCYTDATPGAKNATDSSDPVTGLQ